MNKVISCSFLLLLPGLDLVQNHLQGYELAVCFGNGGDGVNQMYYLSRSTPLEDLVNDDRSSIFQLLCMHDTMNKSS